MIPSDLEQACARYGVAARYRDFWHEDHAAPETTLRAVLAAMGVDPAKPHAAEPRPFVWRVGATPRHADVAVAAPVPAAPLQWDLSFESGGHAGGSCGPGDAAPAGHVAIRCQTLPDDLPTGYHRLVVSAPASGGTVIATAAVIVCPPRCHLPPPARRFGPSVQLYALRSGRNWGIGDFTDLANLARIAAREGADFVGVNPLHALFLTRPGDASPYSPSSRLALNPLYIDVEALDDFAACEAARGTVAAAGFQAELARLRAAALVDYAAVAALKLRVLRQVFDRFDREHVERMTARGRALGAFGDAHPDLAWTPAVFEALHAMLHARDSAAWGWPVWPEQYRDHEAEAVQAFARTHRREVDFFLYLQWQADRQLAAAHEAALAAGMRIGIYRDLAVGANAGGAETWQAPDRYATTVHVGAPPDEFNGKGQDWGLPPWIPHRLPVSGYTPWVALLRANMRHAGALRIDHVMALLRLFWIPQGAAPTDGTYVAYPLDDLVALLALESTRHACAVVGEDLGTVPHEVRAALHSAGVHSYRVLWFERAGDGGFAAPQRYPAQALCSVTTHDLPTLAGFWSGADLAARDALHAYPDPAVRDAQYAERAADRGRLLQALADAGLRASEGPLPATLTQDDVRAVHAYLARTPCALMALQLEDVFGATEQVNLPATSEATHPNWRRKVTVPLEDWTGDGRFASVCAAIRAEGRGGS